MYSKIALEYTFCIFNLGDGYGKKTKKLPRRAI